MKREGDQVDVRNLKETFELRRGCAFKELKSPTKNELFTFLGNNDAMKNFSGTFLVVSILQDVIKFAVCR
jgi:hypothetical protein